MSTTGKRVVSVYELHRNGYRELKKRFVKDTLQEASDQAKLYLNRVAISEGYKPPYPNA